MVMEAMVATDIDMDTMARGRLKLSQISQRIWWIWISWLWLWSWIWLLWLNNSSLIFIPTYFFIDFIFLLVLKQNRRNKS